MLVDLPLVVGALPGQEAVDVFSDNPQNQGENAGVVEVAEKRDGVGDEVQRIDKVQDAGNGEYQSPPGYNVVPAMSPGGDKT